MNKVELIESYAKELNTTKVEAERNLNAFIKVIKDSLKAGEDVKLVGFVDFSVKDVEAHEARNPKTGEIVQVEAKTVVKAKASKTILK